jgi:NAD(P)-dependent dehydrogenase (short-subunit alcohol dehydrogenase family)
MGADGQERLVESIALHRLGTPKEIARAVVFFASNTEAYLTGQTITGPCRSRRHMRDRRWVPCWVW